MIIFFTPPIFIDVVFKIYNHLTLGGDKNGLVCKLGMKEAFTVQSVLNPSFAKRCKGTSADTETTLKGVPWFR